MLRGIKESFVQENQKKDFKKLSKLVSVAKGYRTIGNFAADCRMDVNLIDGIINMKLSTYPSVKQLEIIADYSEGRVSLEELKMACGYSLYSNNDREEIKNIQIRRGWFCYANLGDHAIDSEVGGTRTVLVIQNEAGNIFSPNTITIPLTSRRSKKQLPTHVSVSKECGLREDSIISCELVGTISKRRLLFRGGIIKICECPQDILRKVEVALAKAQGIIDLKVDEQEAINTLTNLNHRTIRNVNRRYENNYSRTPSPQVACAY